MSEERFRQNKPHSGCPSALSIFQYVIGEIDPKAAGRIDEHLAGCAPCRSLVERERSQVERA